MNKPNSWIGFDFDGTLSKYSGWNEGDVGEPVPENVARAKAILAVGIEVRIVTARVGASKEGQNIELQRFILEDWTEKHLGKRLKITDKKDFDMWFLVDDRAVAVEKNTGRLIGYCPGLGLETIPGLLP